MDLGLTDKVALVTGGNRGIGKATARALAREGVDVAIAARDRKLLDQAAREIGEESGRRVVPFLVDTTDDGSVRAMVASVAEAFGHIDILVNCAAPAAAMGPTPKLAGVTTELLWSDVNVKVLGYLRVIREVAPHMIQQQSGRIVNVSGLAARRTGNIIGSIRNVSVVSMTKNVSDELGQHGISVNVVHPATTRTEGRIEMFAAAAAKEGLTVDQVEKRAAGNVLGHLIDASEVADVITFLVSPRAIAINGDVIDLSGGQPGHIFY